MAERDIASGADDEKTPAGRGSAGSDGSGDEWDTAFSRLLEGVSLDELSVPTATGERRARLTFDGLRDRVAEQLREKIHNERLRREAIARLVRQFERASETVDESLHDFVGSLLETFNGGGEVRRQPDPKDGRSRTWQVLGFRSPGRGEDREVVITVLLSMRGMDALDRGQPSLECRVSTPRNPRLLDFTVGTDFRGDLEDAVCRAYQDILGTLRFAPSAEAGVESES